jgi:hypothetical protein
MAGRCVRDPAGHRPSSRRPAGTFRSLQVVPYRIPVPITPRPYRCPYLLCAATGAVRTSYIGAIDAWRISAQLEASLPSIERLQAELTEADIDELEKIHHVAGGNLAAMPSTAAPRAAPASKRHATKTAKTSPGKKTPRSKKPQPTKKASR